jgi:hypothetical protein
MTNGGIKPMKQTTKEPWSVKFEKMGGYDCMTDAYTIYSGDKPIAELDLRMEAHEDEIEANANRIVSCVNYCAGIPNEKLEGRTALGEFAKFENGLEVQK